MFRPVAYCPSLQPTATPSSRIFTKQTLLAMITRGTLLGVGICVLTVSSGCYHMYSQPYGYSGAPVGGTYPGTGPYQAPIQTLTPGQPYVPGGSSPTTIPPGSTSPTYQTPNGGLQPIPESNAPSYNGNQGGSTNTPSNPATPDPYFPSTYNQTPQNPGLSSIQPTAMNEPNPQNPPGAGQREVRSAPSELAENLNAIPMVQTVESPVPAATPTPNSEESPSQSSPLMPLSASGSAPAETFTPPKMSPPPEKTGDPFSGMPTTAPSPASEVAPASAKSLWDVETKKVVTADLATFDHDPKFQWLRGVVSKEPADDTWSIVYDDDPKEDDKWAGHLSLAPSPYLSNLKDGDVVEIHGQIDNVVQDRLGKPVYVISSLTKPFETK